MMNYTESIVFSSAPAEGLNRKAFSLDPRLYLFANYEPKPYPASESKRSQFMTAVINLYGLLWDCGPFLSKLYFGTKDSAPILPYELPRIQNHFRNMRDVVDAFRSIFCHNSTDALPLSAFKRDIARHWVSGHISSGHEIEDLDELNEDEWGALLDALVTDANTFTNDLNDNLDILVRTPSADEKSRAIECWIQGIVQNYLQNPTYLLNCMAGLYQLYRTNMGMDPDWGKPLRSQTIGWLVDFCGVTDRDKWYGKWLDAPADRWKDSKLYTLLLDWPNQWAARNGVSADQCGEAPLPDGDLLRILAGDVDRFAHNPRLGYTST